MTIDTNMIVGRSFSKTDRTKFRNGAIMLSLLIALSFSSMLKPYLGLLSFCMRLSAGDDKKLPIQEKIPSYKQDTLECNLNATVKLEPICRINKTSNYCIVNNNDIRVHANSSSIIFIPSTQVNNISWTIKPYVRKNDKIAVHYVREWTILPSTSRTPLQCTHTHTVPAVLFSTAGYSGNNFHAFSDIIIPLFITSRKFNGEVKFLVADNNRNPNWIKKFGAVLENLSRYEIIDIDSEQEIVHCFPGIIVSLEHHRPLIIDPARSDYSMKDFKAFLRNSYSLKRTNAIKYENGGNNRPRLLIVARKRTRTFLNTEEIKSMAETLGFEVVVADAEQNTTKNANTVNSCDVMMGVHGAGLANMVFLPEGAVFIQIIPLGKMEWHGKVCFGDPAMNMNLRYIEYRIGEKESSLVGEYSRDDVVFKDPHAFTKGNWGVFKSVYLEKQNVELDLDRFRGTLLKAMELLHA